MEQAARLVDITLFEDRLLVHGAEGAVEIPLAYQIHSRLIQTNELARLIAEHAREELGERVPARGSQVRLGLPLAWGLVCLRVPADLDRLEQPEHHAAWEIDTNAPEPVIQYWFDHHASTHSDGQVETRILAVRQTLVSFCRTFLEELGLRLAEIVPAEERGAGFRLDLSRAQAHLEALRQERFETPARWLPWVGWGTLALLAASLIVLVWLQRPAAPVLKPGKTTAAVTTAQADTVAQKVAPPVLDASARQTLAAWRGWLDSLALREAEMPEWFVLDGAGVLARLAPGQGKDLSWGRPARRQAVGRSTAWWELKDPLPGGRMPEDGSRPVARVNVARLADASAKLDRPPARLLLQRRHAAPGAAATRWRFGDGDAGGTPQGWQLVVFPAAGPEKR